MSWKSIAFLTPFFVLVSCESYLPGFDFDNFRNTPLENISIAVKNQDERKIIEEHKELKVELDYCEKKFGNNLLIVAVANNLDESVETLLSLGANVNIESLKIDSGYVKFPITIACTSFHKKKPCDTKILEILIKYGANVNSKSFSYNLKNKEEKINFVTPLMLASEGGCIEVVKTLVQKGANINEFDSNTGKCAITNSLIQENMDILEYLVIDKNAKIPPFCIKGDDGVDITFFEIFDKLNLDRFPEKVKAKKRISNFLNRHMRKE